MEAVEVMEDIKTDDVRGCRRCRDGNCLVMETRGFRARDQEGFNVESAPRGFFFRGRR